MYHAFPTPARRFSPATAKSLVAAGVTAGLCLVGGAASAAESTSPEFHMLSAERSAAVLRRTGALPTENMNATISGPTFDANSYGIKADGRTDDHDALERALNAAGKAGGGVVTIPNRQMRVHGGWLTLPAGVTISGTGSMSEILYTTDSPEEYVALFLVRQNKSGLRNLKITRASDIYGVVVDLGASSNFSMSGVTLQGRADVYRTDYHGIIITGNSGTISGVSIDRCTLRGLVFGLLQPGPVTTTVNGITVNRSTFEGNTASDLEFNAPESRMGNIKVTNSTFRNNLSTGSGAGWGVGLANVQGSYIAANSFTGYQMNAIHVEDRSSNIEIAGNRFVRTSTSDTVYDAPILIISGTHSVKVTRNIIDLRQQSNQLNGVYVGAGGSDLIPYDVNVSSNTFFNNGVSKLLGIYDAHGVTEGTNTLR